MLSVSNVSGAQASHYYEKDGYYARSENEYDLWQGKLTKELSLPREVKPEDFNKYILENPKRAGFDACFSAPKSVSIAALTDTNLRDEIIKAHNLAVSETLAEIERNEIACRVTKNGVEQSVKTGNMATAKFSHFVSRNADPQLHTHCVILNKTMHNGKIYAVDNSNIYKNKILYGQLYRNRLAQNLQKRGFETEIADPERGFFELKGIDQKIIDEFSSRRAEILEKLKEWGANPRDAVAASKATLLTRQAKQSHDLVKLTESWQETVNEVGGVKVEKKPEAIKNLPTAKREAFDRAVARLENKSFAFTENELERAVLAEGVCTGMNREDFQRQLNLNIKQGDNADLVRLGAAKEDDGNIYYSTRQNINTEAEIIKNVTSSQNKLLGTSSEKARQDLSEIDSQLPNDKKLSAEQKTAALHICATKNQYTAIEGLAGTGKTYMLAATRQVLEQNGHTVRGAAFTGQAAEGLETDSKIKSTTIHSMLNRLEKEAGNAVGGEDLSQKSIWNFKGLKPSVKPEVWIIDEAGMVDNRLMLQLQEAAKLKNAKIVLVGDSRQLQPVGIGNAYTNLVQSKRIATCTLSDIRRQQTEQLLSAVKQAVKGDINKSLELVSDSTTEIKSLSKRFDAISKEYTKLSLTEQDKTIVLTAKNKDRLKLNEQIRNELVKQGRLQAGQVFRVKSGEIELSREFSVNDKVIFLQNNSKLKVRNGQTGKIIGIEENKITVQSGEKTIVFNPKEYNKFDHGYCITTHKAQGITTDRVIINIDSTQQTLNNRNKFYVDISRARHQVLIFTDSKEKMGKQVSEFVKKLTSDDFLVKIAKKPVVSLPKPTPKISIPKPSVSLPLPGALKILSIPLKVTQIAIKASVKAAQVAVKAVKMANSSQQETQKNRTIKRKM